MGHLMHVLLTPGPLILPVLVPASLGFRRVTVAGESTTIFSAVCGRILRRSFSGCRHRRQYDVIIPAPQSW